MTLVAHSAFETSKYLLVLMERQIPTSLSANTSISTSDQGLSTTYRGSKHILEWSSASIPRWKCQILSMWRLASAKTKESGILKSSMLTVALRSTRTLDSSPCKRITGTLIATWTRSSQQICAEPTKSNEPTSVSSTMRMKKSSPVSKTPFSHKAIQPRTY